MDNLKMHIKNEKDVTLDDICNEANHIWETFRRQNIHVDDIERNDAYFLQMAKEHKEFYCSYPLVLRHMINDYLYHPDAFRKYLLSLAEKMWTNDSERMDSYTNYAVILYKELNPLWHKDKLKKYKREYRAKLQKEHDTFEKITETVSEQFDKEKKQLEEERRAEKLQLFETLAAKASFNEQDMTQFKTLFHNKMIKEEDLDKLLSQLRGIENV